MLLLLLPLLLPLLTILLLLLLLLFLLLRILLLLLLLLLLRRLLVPLPLPLLLLLLRNVLRSIVSSEGCLYKSYEKNDVQSKPPTLVPRSYGTILCGHPAETQCLWLAAFRNSRQHSGAGTNTGCYILSLWKDLKLKLHDDVGPSPMDQPRLGSEANRDPCTVQQKLAMSRNKFSQQWRRRKAPQVETEVD